MDDMDKNNRSIKSHILYCLIDISTKIYHIHQKMNICKNDFVIPPNYSSHISYFDKWHHQLPNFMVIFDFFFYHLLIIILLILLMKPCSDCFFFLIISRTDYCRSFYILVFHISFQEPYVWKVI